MSDFPECGCPCCENGAVYIKRLDEIIFWLGQKIELGEVPDHEIEENWCNEDEAIDAELKKLGYSAESKDNESRVGLICH